MLNRRARMVAANPRLSHPITSRRHRIAALAALAMIGLGLVWVPSPASAQGPPCHAPALPMLRIELMFGRNIGDDLAVTEDAWASFLASEVVPRFPDGFSVVDAAGPRADKPTANLFVSEPSKIIIIIAPDAPRNRAAHRRRRSGLQEAVPAAIGGGGEPRGVRVVLETAPRRDKQARRAFAPLTIAMALRCNSDRALLHRARMSALLWIVPLVLAGYVAGLVVLYVFQRRLLYLPQRRPISPAAAGFPEAEAVVLETSDGERVIAWHVPPRPGHPLVIYFHGNAETIANRVDRHRAADRDRGRPARGVLPRLHGFDRPADRAGPAARRRSGLCVRGLTPSGRAHRAVGPFARLGRRGGTRRGAGRSPSSSWRRRSHRPSTSPGGCSRWCRCDG